ncbi:glycosyltransferase family 4 protein [Fictibacillus enclensis]|uniref:glycosyltransferase family 4 protein n=1 Tax=Fictibacillus TaxID=1329200 RepID=UPI001012C888|nr:MULTISPECIES: glycosyltransferase family 4 protein [Fictibacillus]MDM5340089.1 glycosyltransferase family 4 protein [Fictibacillus enclensis]RXZ01829.1 glycosyl transferase [Fictibacillus sp. S7]WHY71615.1 glycosyltransferase family 4 protein [Fictibacillus enclensis]
MKICHLTSVHPADDIRIFVKECRSLALAGHDVYLVAPNTENKIIDNVKVVGITSASGNRYKRMVDAAKSVYRAAIEIDAEVYHFHDPELMVIGLLLKRKGKKVIYDVHEDVPEQVLSKQWIPKPLRKNISVSVRRMEKFAAAKFDAVVTATPTITKRFKTYNANTVTVHNFPILQELIENSPRADRNRRKDNSFLYIGGITELRGIKEMVLAIEFLNGRGDEGELVLAGKFAPPALEQEMKQKDGWQHVDHKGWLGRSEVKDVLSQSTAGLVLIRPEPRYMVSYPIKLFEYMAAGIPSIASNFPLWEDFVIGNKCGLCVDPLDAEAIANAMKWLMDHPEEARQMGENGRKAVIEKYNWEKESQELVALYERLAGAGNRSLIWSESDEGMDFKSRSVKTVGNRNNQTL